MLEQDIEQIDNLWETLGAEGTSQELTLSSPMGDEYFLNFRGDGMVEVRAGDASLALDANNGAIVLRCNSFKVISTTATRFHTSSFHIGWDMLNPDYLSVGDFQVEPAMMIDPLEKVVQGPPCTDCGQYATPLEKLFTQHRVFLSEIAKHPSATISDGISNAIKSLGI